MKKNKRNLMGLAMATTFVLGCIRATTVPTSTTEIQDINSASSMGSIDYSVPHVVDPTTKGEKAQDSSLDNPSSVPGDSNFSNSPIILPNLKPNAPWGVIRTPEPIVDGHYPRSGGGGGGGGGSVSPQSSGRPSYSLGDPYRREVYPTVPEQAYAGQLTATQWVDLNQWRSWLSLIDGSFQSYKENWQIETKYRLRVQVKSGDRPQADIRVSLIDEFGENVFEARTNNQGRAELFANAFQSKSNLSSYKVRVLSKQASREVQISPQNAQSIVVDLPQKQEPSKILDLMFVTDTTSSMGDELNFLKAELDDVIKRVSSSNHHLQSIRVSTNFYRDVNDPYVVRSFPFSQDISSVLKQLNNQFSSGGGDFEEAVELALYDGVFEHQWSDSALARLLFLVLDAPPHLTPEVISKLHRTIKEAARKGIRIIPVTASGINKETEFLMRTLGVITDGSYVAITDHSGIGSSHIKPSTETSDILFLNDLLVKIINSYLETESTSNPL